MSVSLSEWGAVIDGAQEERKELFNLIEERVELRNPPKTSHRYGDVKTEGSRFVPFTGESREFLIFENEDFSDYDVRVCAEPYGNVLTVHVAMTALKKTADEWDEQSWEEHTMVSDWATVLFRSCREACEELTEQLEEGKSRLDKEAEGILSIW